MKRLLMGAGVALTLAACNDPYASSGKSLSPIPPQTMALMSAKGMTKSDPIVVRLYKKESELEVWKKAPDGHYAVLKTFPICRWSGQLGPKRREGDRQAPEGFYTITPGQMNPNSAYYLSFDTGYPNAYDKAHNGTGAQLMVHGTCSSRGCYAMTDEGISEVYALARESFAGGQRGFQFQAYPFRMTAENLAKFRADPNMPFWKNLKEGSDHFEVTGREPKVAVCNGRYAFDTVGSSCTPDPTLAPAIAEKEEGDRAQVAELVAKGTPAVRLVYQDGGQHESFRRTALAWSDSNRSGLGTVSRPEALAEGPQEVAVEDTAKSARPTLVAALVPSASRKPVFASRLADASRATDTTSPSGTPRAGRMQVASADPDDLPIATASTAEAPAAAEAPAGDKPFYARMLGSVFGGSRDADRPSEASTTTAPAIAVMPPRRNVATSGKPSAPAKPATSAPSASLPVATPSTAGKHVDAIGFVPGAFGVGTSAGGFARN